MRMMSRIVTIVSLALLVASAAVWVRSYYAGDGWMWSDGVRVPTAGYSVAWRKLVVVHGGRVHLIAERLLGAMQPLSARVTRDAADFQAHMYRNSGTPTVYRHAMGFEYHSRAGHPVIASNLSTPPVELMRVWTIPLWAPTLLFAVLPARWLFLHLRRRKRAGKNRCRECGYDLRASPERCPECGTAM